MQLSSRFYIRNFHDTFYDFKDKDEALAWHCYLDEAKNTIGCIGHFDTKKECKENKKELMEWLDAIVEFRTMFGDEKVPKEIMDIVWKVQDGLNIPRSLYGGWDDCASSDTSSEISEDDED